MSHLVLIKKIFLPPLFSVKMQPFSFFHELVWLKPILETFLALMSQKRKKNTKQRPYMCFNVSVYMCVCYSLMSR